MIMENFVNFIMIYHFYQKELKFEKVEKLVANLHELTEYVKQIRNLKPALNHGLVLSYIDINTVLKKSRRCLW